MNTPINPSKIPQCCRIMVQSCLNGISSTLTIVHRGQEALRAPNAVTAPVRTRKDRRSDQTSVSLAACS